jgi:hypothetical protein
MSNIGTAGPRRKAGMPAAGPAFRDLSSPAVA